MAEFLPIFVLAPQYIEVIIQNIILLFRQHQLRKTAIMLRKNGVKHALVTEDQILF